MSERTRQDILRAYNKLITRLDMEKISVEKLAKEAGISRATFYRHFKDKYDVMNYNYKILLDSMSRPEVSSGYEELYEKLYRYGRMNWKFLQRAFSTHGINSLCEYIATYSCEFVEKMTVMNRGTGFTEAERIQMDVFTIGISTMYKKWIFDQYNLSAKEAAKALFEIMPPTLREMWWVD